MWALLRQQKFVRATAMLVGTMVGVGMFGVPFVVAKSGFWLGMGWLVVVAALTITYDLLFAQVILSTQGQHHVSGYANIWLGPWARRLAFFANVLASYGTLLAYMIVVGEFLHNILSRYIAINPELYGVIFAIGWSLMMLVRLRVVALVDTVLTYLIGLVVIVMMVYGLPHIVGENFAAVTWEFWFLPYGVFFFAFAGINGIPLMRQYLVGREELLRPAIVTAVVWAGCVYALFSFLVVGVTGDVTTPESITGLFGFLGGGIVVLGSVLGVLTISTSFLMVGSALYETFHLDYRLARPWAWLLVVVPPLLFFWSGLRNFIDVIGLVGSVGLGLLSVIVVASWLKARHFALRQPEWTIPLPPVVAWLLMVVFTAGIGYTFWVR